MPEPVKPMFRECETLDHEFVCLGEAFPREEYAHLSSTVEAWKGAARQKFASIAQAGGASPWDEPSKV